MKLVAHCKDRSEKLHDCVFKEYLIYKAYNIIAEESFNVRLAKITYVDEDGKYGLITKYGFFIEDDDDVAARNGMTVMKVANIHQKHTDYFKMAKLSLFQYMIGNTDWSVPKLHNIVLLSEHVHSPPVAVPFDFDWSGLVNAPYAVPDQVLETADVKQRVYRGYFRPEKDMLTIVELYNEKKDELINLFAEFPFLSVKEKQKCIQYLGEFYEIINDKRKFKNEIVKAARRK